MGAVGNGYPILPLLDWSSPGFRNEKGKGVASALSATREVLREQDRCAAAALVGHRESEETRLGCANEGAFFLFSKMEEEFNPTPVQRVHKAARQQFVYIADLAISDFQPTYRYHRGHR